MGACNNKKYGRKDKRRNTMNSNRNTIFILIGLLVLLAVSYVLYDKFTGNKT